MAQLGSALAWGARGRRFESCYSDHYKKKQSRLVSTFLICLTQKENNHASLYGCFYLAR